MPVHKLHESLGTIACGKRPDHVAWQVVWDQVTCDKCFAKKGKIKRKSNSAAIFFGNEKPKGSRAKLSYGDVRRSVKHVIKTMGRGRPFQHP